ncbi:MAG: sel1 repeat family protein, partial [Myxococcus sp.]|nr:sel1 repeat family protein [Myxococcus sp.]
DDRLAALRVGDGHSTVEAPALVGLGVAGIKDVVWRIAAEATGTCQLAVTAELDDPLEEATFFRVRLEPASTEFAPPRVKAAAFTDTTPERGQATLRYPFPCFTSPQWIQFEVQGPSGLQFSRAQRVWVPTVLPGVVRGRTGPSEGAGPPSSLLVTELWELPAPITLNHACREAPHLCERACLVDEFEACTLDGRIALAARDLGRALNRFDAMCERGDLEACTLLEWTLAEKKPTRQLRSRPAAVLQPWCDAGLRRACVALAIPEWRKALPALTAGCVQDPRACGALGLHLLDGPRLDAEVTRALKLIQQACLSGDAASCAHSAIETLRFAREEPLAVMPRLKRACEARIADACTLMAMNSARGLTVPRTPRAAEQELDEACRLGAAEACQMCWRP